MLSSARHIAVSVTRDGEPRRAVAVFNNEQRSRNGLTTIDGMSDAETPSIHRFAVLGNHLPRRCGLATFTTHITDALSDALPGADGFVVAMNLETTEEDLMHTIFPHPTLSETMKESVLDAYGQALNI